MLLDYFHRIRDIVKTNKWANGGVKILENTSDSHIYLAIINVCTKMQKKQTTTLRETRVSLSSVTLQKVTSAVGNAIMRRLTSSQRWHGTLASPDRSSTLQARHNTTQSANHSPRSGRYRVTVTAQERYIQVCHLWNQTTTATTTETQIPGLRIIS